MNIYYVNGVFCPAEEARVPLDERAFLYGDGVFETLRTHAGILFQAELHAQRMLDAARQLQISTSLTNAELVDILRDTAEKNYSGKDDVYLRAQLTRGTGAGPSICKEMQSNLYIIAKPYAEPPEDFYEKGLCAIFSKRRRSSASDIFQYKSCAYLENLLCRAEAEKARCDEAIILDTDGHVLEGACANIFTVKNGTLFTPASNLNLLSGITRRIVFELAEGEGIKVEEAELQKQDLKEADEVFLTNSLRGIMPLVKIEECVIGGGRPGRITRKLRELYLSESTRSPSASSRR